MSSTQQNRRVGRTQGHGDDLEGGVNAALEGAGPRGHNSVGFYQPRSSITVKGGAGNSPGTASKEDRRGRPGPRLQGGELSSSHEMPGALGGHPKTIALGGNSSSFLVIGFLVLIWYSFAVAAVTLSKKIMMEVQLPNMLCTCQFLSASIATKMLEDVMGHGGGGGVGGKGGGGGDGAEGTPHAVDRSARYRLPNFTWLLAQIAVSYTFGFVLTNMAFSVVTASFAETVKSAEPISSVIMGFFVLKEEATLATYLTLIPICAGVSISCFHDDSFALSGFLFAAASNICFSARAVLAKKLLKQYPGSITELEMFRLISLMGLAVLVPLTLVTEGTEIYAFLSGDATMTQTYWELLSLLFLNGLAYSVYNLTSFLVLGRTNLVTHAVLNCFRRVFIIVFTAMYFNVEISQFNMLGVVLAVIGVCLFAHYRALKKSEGREE